MNIVNAAHHTVHRKADHHGRADIVLLDGMMTWIQGGSGILPKILPTTAPPGRRSTSTAPKPTRRPISSRHYPAGAIRMRPKSSTAPHPAPATGSVRRAATAVRNASSSSVPGGRTLPLNGRYPNARARRTDATAHPNGTDIPGPNTAYGRYVPINCAISTSSRRRRTRSCQTRSNSAMRAAISGDSDAARAAARSGKA